MERQDVSPLFIGCLSYPYEKMFPGGVAQSVHLDNEVGLTLL